MKTFLVNLDYEAFLFGPNYNAQSSKNIAAIKEFEYVFFLVNKDICRLKNYKNYSQNYLDKLKELGFFIPEFSSEDNKVENWWGKKTNLELEKKLNSKLTSCEIARKYGWGFLDGKVVSNLEEVNSHIENLPHSKFLLKSPFSFSGIGHSYFEKGNVPLVKFNSELLLEPVYNRVCDIGYTYVQENGNYISDFLVLNFNNEKGSFKGGMGFKNIQLALDFISTEYGFNFSEIEINNYKKIVDIYKNLGAKENIQIDSFIYKDELSNKLKLYQLVEVNYRKTMGLIINSLCEHFNRNRIEFRITHTGQFENDSNWIKLSPEDNKFNSYIRLF